MKKFLETAEFENDLVELFQLSEAIYQEAYQKRGKKHVVTAEGKLNICLPS